MEEIIQGSVAHEVKVTRIKGVGYGVRVFVNGEVNQQGIAGNRSEIGAVARGMLRFEDKCGNHSDYAHRARHSEQTKRELQLRKLEAT